MRQLIVSQTARCASAMRSSSGTVTVLQPACTLGPAQDEHENVIKDEKGNNGNMLQENDRVNAGEQIGADTTTRKVRAAALTKLSQFCCITPLTHPARHQSNWPKTPASGEPTIGSGAMCKGLCFRMDERRGLRQSCSGLGTLAS